MSAFDKITFEKFAGTSDAARKQARYDAHFAHLLGHADAPPNRFAIDVEPARYKALFQSYLARRGLIVGREVKRKR